MIAAAIQFWVPLAKAIFCFGRALGSLMLQSRGQQNGNKDLRTRGFLLTDVMIGGIILSQQVEPDARSNLGETGI